MIATTITAFQMATIDSFSSQCILPALLVALGKMAISVYLSFIVDVQGLGDLPFKKAKREKGYKGIVTLRR